MSHPFFSAPHRVMFAAGSLQLLASMAFWLVELVSRTGVMGTPSVPAVPPLWLHAGTMIFGIFPFFIFGFLMTALPKWMAAEPLAPGATDVDAVRRHPLRVGQERQRLVFL
ncbi:MAG TPA: NnrS family protein, partial [Rhodocyclaceae bacterium]|nr:NnrS family protein [Rhodocyclaceae bacterium]